MQTDWAVLSLSGDPYAGGTNTASEAEQLGQGSAVLALMVCHLCALGEASRPSGYSLTLLVVIPPSFLHPPQATQWDPVLCLHSRCLGGRGYLCRYVWSHAWPRHPCSSIVGPATLMSPFADGRQLLPFALRSSVCHLVALSLPSVRYRQVVTGKSSWLDPWPRSLHRYKVTPGRQGLSAKQGVEGLRDLGAIYVAYGKGTLGFRLVLYTVGSGLSSGLGTGRGILGRKQHILDSRQHKAGPSGLLYSCLPQMGLQQPGSEYFCPFFSRPLRPPSLLPLFPSSLPSFCFVFSR